MWPSLFFNHHEGPLHSRALLLAKTLLGEDMAFDFDHVISKPHSKDVDNEFDWHQDEGYWRLGMGGLTFPDLRAASIWVALDQADEDNGCLWMVPGSHHHGYIEHRQVKQGHHTITIDMDTREVEEAARPYPVPAGGAVVNTGRTLHCSKRNTSQAPRRAYILNFRPAEMIALERAHGFDHGKTGLQTFSPP